MNKILVRTALLCALCLAPGAGASTNPGSAVAMPVVVRDIEPAAADAVKVVDAFAAAIKAGKIEQAGALLDPGLFVLESGGGERSREQYLAEHAAADAKYMQTVEQELRYRKARAQGGMAWVATESILTRKQDGVSSVTLSAETMLLRNTSRGWKIVHIHWSSHSVG